MKNVLKQTGKSLNTKFGPQWKNRKSSYQVGEILALFCKLIAVILGLNCVKGLTVTKIFKKIKFEGVLGELESKKVSRDCLQNFVALFMSLLTASIVKDGHV